MRKKAQKKKKETKIANIQKSIKRDTVEEDETQNEWIGVVKKKQKIHPIKPENKEVTQTPIFCHFFNNDKECRYKEKCKFLHKTSPQCRRKNMCNRTNCMYRHNNGLENVTNSEINSNTEKNDQENIYVTKDIGTVYDVEKRLEKLQERFNNNPSLIQNVEVMEDFNILMKLIDEETNPTEEINKPDENEKLQENSSENEVKTSSDEESSNKKLEEKSYGEIWTEMDKSLENETSSSEDPPEDEDEDSLEYREKMSQRLHDIFFS